MEKIYLISSLNWWCHLNQEEQNQLVTKYELVTCRDIVQLFVRKFQD